MSVGSKNFVVDMSWPVLLRDLDISGEDLLRKACLPLDLFSRKSPTLTTDEYFRLWEVLANLPDEPAFPLRLGQSIPVEAFSPPIFACFCSADLNAALARLAQYKPLIGPLRLDVTQSDRQTMVALGGLPGNTPLPASLIATELVFLVHLARRATREQIIPKAVDMTAALPEQEKYESFFRTRIRRGKINGLTFSAADAQRPFLTANENLWSVFEPELRKRMADLGLEAKFRDRVRACLMETLASGQCSMIDIAKRLGVSSRTLQRRLHEENTNFKRELNRLREELGRHYLANSRYSSAEISFLLGYDDPNSFVRAFHAWTGEPPMLARSSSRPH